ncbi:hypothetical protein FACS189452_10530 [Bacteroidia bacterium]|nr:hypothetical protein FACS189452_10530 [Bacteroidia bacterium]GHT80218.1 hypothetical protein FACS189467_1840 [Bacteroidia bacterium]
MKDDLVSFEQELLKNPYIGDDLGGNVRKIRIAITSKNKGKRGGARIITYNLIVNVEDAEVYLLSIYDKSQKTNISAQEIEQIKQNHGLT